MGFSSITIVRYRNIRYNAPMLRFTYNTRSKKNKFIPHRLVQNFLLNLNFRYTNEQNIYPRALDCNTL